MTLNTFFEHFDRFAEAPNAVAKMRELILQLAVQGKLVAQDSDDEPASKSLMIMERERLALISKGQIKRRKIQSLKNQSFPFAIPSGWSWARLAEVGHDLGQKAPNSTFTYIDVGGIDSEKGRVSDRVAVLDFKNAPSRARKIVRRGTVIYSTVRPYLLNIAIIDQTYEPEPIASTAFGILHPFSKTNNQYLFYWLRSASFTAYVEDGMKGMAYPAINDAKFYNGYIPLPPLAEQKRIVAKVDELMALCDKLETQQRERDQIFPLLSRSAHARFAASPTPTNLEAIFTESINVSPDDVRKTILDLAFKGYLVSQEKGDKPAIESINEIKQTLISATKRGKKGQSLKLIPPYELPQNWTWSTFPMLGEFGRGKSKHRPRNDSSLYVNGVYPLVQTGDVSRSHGSIKTFTGKYNEKGLAQSKIWPVGTLCITIAANIADTGILEFEACFPDSVVGFIPSEQLPSVRYFEYFMRTAKDRLMEFAPATAQKNINLGILEQVLIPIPPLAEQKRIVTKVDELMAVVDKLEKQQKQKNEVAALYAQTAVAEITGTEIKEQKKMKAPKTELVTRLELGKKPKASDNAPLAKLITKHKGLSAKALWQQSGLEIDAFYQQLKTEMAKGWIVEPEKAVMKEVTA
jgi:type I restriction enzyme S subunit